MKLIVKKYNIDNEKLAKKVSICVMSDFHFSHIIDDKRLNLILDSIKKNKPNYICIIGDYIDSANMLKDKIIYDKSVNFLKKLCMKTKVIFILGNHDICTINNKKRRFYLDKKWINEISKIKNFIYLDNNIYEDDNMRFIGYNASFRYYSKKNEDKKLLIKDINNNLKNINNLKNDKYTILLFHSPIHIFSDDLLNKTNLIKDVDLILCGHMHNGLTPNFIDKLWKSNKGLVSPHRHFFPDNARGIKRKYINNHDIYLVISGGVTKVHEVAPKMLHFLNKFYNPEVAYIDLKNKLK